MEVVNAKKKVKQRRLVATLMVLVASIFLILSILKSLYVFFSLDKSITSGISHALQGVIQFIYMHTQFLNVLWKWAPVANLQHFSSSGNYGLIFIAFCLALGLVVWSSASNLSQRIIDATREAEKQRWVKELSDK